MPTKQMVVAYVLHKRWNWECVGPLGQFSLKDGTPTFWYRLLFKGAVFKELWSIKV